MVDDYQFGGIISTAFDHSAGSVERLRSDVMLVAWVSASLSGVLMKYNGRQMVSNVNLGVKIKLSCFGR
jgi:hypothetical protein